MKMITRAYGASKLALKAKAPTLMVAAGVVSMGASVITASKQTLKVEEVLAKHTPALERINQGEALGNESYGSEVAQQDRFRVYSRVGVDLVRLYAVPGVLFVGGSALVFGGHRVLLKRNATLAIAYTALDSAFTKYRNRVVENFGSEVDQGMLNGWVKKEVIDPETGKTEIVNTRDWEESRGDPYNRVFEQGATSAWQPDVRANKMFLANQQKFAQERLIAQGYLYLGDVYKALGFPETDISRVVGWKVTHNPDGSKNFPAVDFGIDKPHPDDWKFDQEKAIFLDFNCHGLIVGGVVQKALEEFK